MKSKSATLAEFDSTIRGALPARLSLAPKASSWKERRFSPSARPRTLDTELLEALALDELPLLNLPPSSIYKLLYTKE